MTQEHTKASGDRPGLVKMLTEERDHARKAANNTTVAVLNVVELDTIIAALEAHAHEGMVMVPREADYGLIERMHDTRDWEAEDYANAQLAYAMQINRFEKALSAAPTTDKDAE